MIKTFASDGPDAGNQLEARAAWKGASRDHPQACSPPRSNWFSASRRCPRRRSIAQFQLGANDGGEALVLPRLLYKIASPAPHGLDSEIDSCSRRS